MNAGRTARERARAELSDEIKAVARRQLATVGAQGLSLRAVSRELGMVSSAIYRYFPSRDDLLTVLIIDAYDALGEAAEAAAVKSGAAFAVRSPETPDTGLADTGSGSVGSADAGATLATESAEVASNPQGAEVALEAQGAEAAREAQGAEAAREAVAGDREAAPGAGAWDVLETWGAVFAAVRDWARANPQEYALIYGSPVLGYQAPQATVQPAVRVPILILGLLQQADAEGRLVPPDDAPEPDGVLASQVNVLVGLAPGVPPRVLLRMVIVWTQLFGMINFELFGQLVGSMDPADEFFASATKQMATFVGLS
ncbi:TetR/AcrR family transcriptional regulator [Kribbella sp. NPDC026596]|uniref:TetR/AcrR family transcriptional regulator n=1 Tax=Kribbella sp. NPDC026596 TaxID=3155122 RepID=UPI0033EBDFF4